MWELLRGEERESWSISDDEFFEEIDESIDEGGCNRQKTRTHRKQLQEYEKHSAHDHRAWFTASAQIQIRIEEHQFGGHQGFAMDCTVSSPKYSLMYTSHTTKLIKRPNDN